MQLLHPTDIFIIFGYLIACLIIGFIASKKINNIKDYAIGGKYVPTTLLIGTFIATDIGAGSTIGVTEKVYSSGLVLVLGIMLRPFFWLIAFKIFSQKIEYFRNQHCISIGDIAETLYGNPARWIINLMSILISIGILSLQISAIGYLLNYFLNVSSEKCALLSFAIIVTYSFFGGIKAVIVTDLMQAVIFIIGIPLACFLGFSELNMSLEAMIKQLPASHTSIDWTFHNSVLFISLIFHSLITLVDAPLMQRYLMANNADQLKKVMLRCFFISVPFTFIICLIGFIIKISAPDINPNHAFFHLINTYLPIGAKGFLIAGLLAVIMSTADSWLNTASVICAHDIVKRILPFIGSRLELRIARLSLLFVSGLASFVALSNNESVYAPWLVVSFWSPVVLIPICSGFLGFRTSTKSFIISSIMAIIFVLVSRYQTGEFSTISMTMGIIGSSIGLFGAHYWQKLKGIGMTPSNNRAASLAKP